MNTQYPILLIDDEEQILFSYETILESEGIENIICCSDSRKALGLLREHNAEIILLDLTMPHISGEELLSIFVKEYPEIPVIVATGITLPAIAVQCIKTGAYDYLDKPIERERFVTTINNALSYRLLKRENEHLTGKILKRELSTPEAFADILTQNDTMLSIFNYIEAIAPSPNPVLITGETGTGKELIAKAIYKAKKLAGKFIPVNVAGLDDTMFSDTLFGHRKGAFTGALSNRPGLLESAENGALFLDEIGDLSLNSQIKLLRLIQEREYHPIGADDTLSTNAHLICATNKDLVKMMNNGDFREDLYYRLFAHHIQLPPLKERKDDIPILIDFFINKAANSLNKKTPTYPQELISLLSAYSFPGNIRELEAIIMDAISRHKSKMLSLSTFKKSTLSTTTNNNPRQTKSIFGETLPKLKDVQPLLIQEALTRTNGNKSQAASLLGTSRQALNWHLKKMKS